MKKLILTLLFVAPQLSALSKTSSFSKSMYYIMTDSLISEQHALTLAAAKEVMESAEEIAAEKELQIVVAVVDNGGNLLAFHRMDGAGLVSIDVAIGKAKTAVKLQAPSKVFEEMINNGQTAMLTVPDLVPLRGGIPIYYQNKLVGAVGISGSTGENDEAVAIEAAKLFD